VQPHAIIGRVTEPLRPGDVRPDDLRASDAERAQVQDRLRRAHDVGQLDLGEFDDRVRTAWAARTRGELAGLTADLPLPPPPPPERSPSGVFAPTSGGVAMRVLTLVWLIAVTVNLTAWGIVALTAEVVHPWWLWVAGPPGAVLGVLYVAGIGRPRR
jgi:Domain of unknown function (DUF1707)